MLAYAVRPLAPTALRGRRPRYVIVMKKCSVRLDAASRMSDDLGMTTTPPPAPGTHAARLAEYSAARPEIVLNDRPARRLPPRSRRHSVKHRAIR